MVRRLGSNGSEGDGVSSRRSSGSDGSARNGVSSKRSPPRTKHFNGARTAWILSLLVLITLLMQIILVVNHDAFMMEVNYVEGEVVKHKDTDVVESIATDTINAAYEHNDVESVGGSARTKGLHWSNPMAILHTTKADSLPMFPPGTHTTKREIATIQSKFSMKPVDILKRAGVDHTAGYTPSVTGREARQAMKSSAEAGLRKEAELPSLDEIQSMYGDRPFIQGLERCEEFRNTVSPENRLVGPAGLFNSATNLLNRLLKLNCGNKARFKTEKQPLDGILLQAPWGKHNPVQWRLHHKARVMRNNIQQEDFLPIVMIKDPITWMSSMCRHPYEARWYHTPKHCPNLVPNEFDKGRAPGKGSMEIKVKFATSSNKNWPGRPIPDEKDRTFIEYDSLVELWNMWYNAWHAASFPRLMVRFEDLIFHAEETVTAICDCAGGTMKPQFRYVEDSAKGQGGPHAGSAGFLASLVTYGNRTLRMEDILKEAEDKEYAREHLDASLMEIFGYAAI